MPDRIATELLLIARSPLTGRIRHRAALDKGLRAALFLDLALVERLTAGRYGPVVLDHTPTGDRILDTVLAAVDRRSELAWRRWYHHVAADRLVITKELLQSGRWTRSRDWLGRVKYLDADPDATLVLVHGALQVAERRQAPTDGPQAILAVLTSICGSISGRPRPRDFSHGLGPVLDGLGLASDPIRRTAQLALDACASSIRRRSRILG